MPRKIAITALALLLLFSLKNAVSGDMAALKENYKEYCNKIFNEDSSCKSKRREFLNNVIYSSFPEVEGIEKTSVWDYETLDNYLGKEGKFVRIFYSSTLKDTDDDRFKGVYNCIVGNIVETNEQIVHIDNEELAEIVGKEMIWKACYFTPETADYFGTVTGKNKIIIWTSPEDITSYINVDEYPQKVNPHEMRHQDQIRKGLNSEYSTSWLELDAIAFNLAQSKSELAVKEIDYCIQYEKYSQSEYYKPGQIFKKYLADRGMTISDLYKATPEQLEKIGVDIFKMANEKGEAVFDGIK